ncbi:MAG: glycosyltransferase family 9 protein [Candidatus Pacearchaeota archaeon]
MEKWNKKCRFFNEKYACDTLASEGYTSCNECKFSQSYSKKILIIKLGAMGDVIRTTCILPAIKKKYGEDVLIYWVTHPESFDSLKDNPLVDKTLTYNSENILRLQQEKFDILFSLDINPPATLLANLVKADEKFGYFFDEGATNCFNKYAEDYLETAFLNHIKLNNKRTYQDLIFQICELNYNKEKPIFNLTERGIKFREQFKINNKINENDHLIGINIGSSSRWNSKFWDIPKIKELIKRIPKEYKIIIFAGPNEISKQKNLIEEMSNENIYLLKNNPENNIEEFASLISICDIIICGDTMALHLASALNKKVIALFFATPYDEIEDYGNISKVVSPLFKDYFLTNYYIPELAESILIEEVIKYIPKI